MEPAGLPLRLLLLGDSGVGKAGLLRSFTEGAFEPRLEPTVGVDFKAKKMVVEARAVQLAIWDTAGQERFGTLTPSYYRGAQGVVLETSAKTQDGVQDAFEELVIKVLQTPGLWEKSTAKKGVQLVESSAQQDKGFCGAYCPLI